MTCDHDPKATFGPVGMYHCPDCGLMVLAGLGHPEIRRFAPRPAPESPRIDISDRTEMWGPDDEFYYLDDDE
jgi:hypothetical protein